MSYYIIIRGPLGSGKSTISGKLAQILPAKHIHIDTLLDENGLDKAPSGAPCIPAENFIKLNEIILPEVTELLNKGNNVIFDACFYHKEVIEHLVQNLPFEHYIFTLKAPLELCIKRDIERHKTYGEGAAWAVHTLVSRFDYGMNIDVSGTLDETLKQLLTFLPKAEIDKEA